MEVSLNLTTLNHTHEQIQESDKDSQDAKARTVILIGSGDMALALVLTLYKANWHPIIASRNPDKARKRLRKLKHLDVEVTTIPEALIKGDIIIVAIPSEHHSSLPKDSFKNKILVDISNRSSSVPLGRSSLAEDLQNMFPESHVVKAFNTLSAYAITSGLHQGSREVPFCGDATWARSSIETLIRELGYTPVDQGALRNARAVEEIPLSFFPEWKTAFIIGLCFFIFNWLIALFRKQLCPNIESTVAWDWSLFNKLPLNNTQITLAFTAATLLLLTYIPGTFAAYIQLYRGTKYSQFPNWLDKWLKCRKQLGLLTLLLGLTHACGGIIAIMPDDLTEEWKEQLFLVSGPLTGALLTVLGITSLPSVSARLTWREFSFIQRHLGWFAIVTLFLHAVFCNWDSLLNKPSCVVIPHHAQIFFVECVFAFLLKIPLLLPCVNSHLMKIRNGYERSSSSTGIDT